MMLQRSTFLLASSLAFGCGNDDAGAAEADGSSSAEAPATTGETPSSSSATTSTTDAADSSTSADDGSSSTGEPVDLGEYLLASLQVADFEAFQADYGAAVFPMLIENGGEVLVATPEVDLLEGEYPQNWTVVVRFPDAAAATGWYESDEYQALIPARHATTDVDASRLLFAPEFAPGAGTEPAPNAHYLLASLMVEDFDAFQTNYGAGVFPLIAAAGGEVLVGSPEVDLREGEYMQNWTVVVRFPDEAAAVDWYESDEYQALIPERHATTDLDASRLLFAPGFERFERFEP